MPRAAKPPSHPLAALGAALRSRAERLPRPSDYDGDVAAVEWMAGLIQKAEAGAETGMRFQDMVREINLQHRATAARMDAASARAEKEAAEAKAASAVPSALPGEDGWEIFHYSPDSYSAWGKWLRGETIPEGWPDPPPDPDDPLVAARLDQLRRDWHAVNGEADRKRQWGRRAARTLQEDERD